MDYVRAKLVRSLIEYFENDDRRVDHALKVLHHADRIAADRDDCDDDLLAAVALFHDVGIKPSEAELGYNDGATQESYGPAVAEDLMRELAFPEETIVKAKEIIGNHHSLSRYDYPELVVLKAADRIVNMQDLD